jgi:hypothetical protein
MVIKALINWKNKPLLKKRLTACGIYLLMSVLIFASKNSHLLFYTSMPPFGRPTYSFENQKWAYTD